MSNLFWRMFKKLRIWCRVAPLTKVVLFCRVWRPSPGNPSFWDFFIFIDCIRTGIWKKLVLKSVSEPVSEQTWCTKSLGIGLRNIWFSSPNFLVLRLSHCKNFGVGLGLGIGLVPSPGLLNCLDGIGTKLGHAVAGICGSCGWCANMQLRIKIAMTEGKHEPNFLEFRVLKF